MSRSDLRPTADPSRHPTRRIPVGLLGMLALIVGVELALSGHHADLATVWADDWRRTAEASTREARGRDILCFGDSLIKFGVLPRVIEATSGLRAYNLALNAGTVPSEYFLLRRTLQAGVRPRVIVADFCPLMLPDEPRGSIRNYPELMTARDLVDLACTAHDADFAAMVLLGRLLPSLRSRHEIRDKLAIRLGWRPAGSTPGREVRVARGAWRKHLGAQPMPRAATLAPVAPELLASLTPPSWTADAINTHYVELFLDLADQHGIPVFWIIPPLGPEIEAGRQAQGTAASYSRFVVASQRRHPELVVIDARGSGYNASTHCDCLHLSDQGARVISGDLARVIADRLAGHRSPSWVNLPPVGDRAIAAGPHEGRATR